MPTLHDITRTLHAYWAQQAPAGLCTLFPGTTLETGNLSEWVEFWVDSADVDVKRPASPDQTTLFVTVHCFAQDRQDTLKAQALADTTNAILSGKVIPVTSASTQQQIALIRTQEAVIRNLTRAHLVNDQLTLQHLIVTLSASVTECT